MAVSRAGRPASSEPAGSASPLRVAFGSCRAAAPLYDRSYGADALHSLAERTRRQPVDEWPDLLMLLGDQVYADDNISPLTLARIRYRRGASDGRRVGSRQFRRIHRAVRGVVVDPGDPLAAVDAAERNDLR